jgi:hypothetical protein
MLGSWTQASRANQAWSIRQSGQLVREKNTALRLKLSRSVRIPVGIASPVRGHLTMSIPMRASLDIAFDCLFSLKKAPTGWNTPCVGAAILGGIARTCGV